MREARRLDLLSRDLAGLRGIVEGGSLHPSEKNSVSILYLRAVDLTLTVNSASCTSRSRNNVSRSISRGVGRSMMGSSRVSSRTKGDNELGTSVRPCD
jgi:hypothetical protein